jgi:drug/metabolite transporter (DMT)-like permease
MPLSPARARLLIVCAALLWSTGGAAIKSSQLGAPAIAGGRAVFAMLVLGLIFPQARHRPNQEVGVASLAYAGVCTLFVFANTLTTAANAIFIQNIAPIWVLLLAPRLLAEKPTRPELISIPIALVGCALFFAEDLGRGRWSGNLCALAASVSFAVLILMYRKLTSIESFRATVWGNLWIVIMMAPLAIQGPAPTPRDLIGIAYLGLVQQALAALLFVRGIRGVSALEGSLLILLEPLFSPLWAFLLVGERIGALAIAGAVLVLISTLYRLRAAAR